MLITRARKLQFAPLYRENSPFFKTCRLEASKNTYCVFLTPKKPPEAVLHQTLKSFFSICFCLYFSFVLYYF